MKTKSASPLLPLFRKFITESLSGKRLKANGSRIRLSTIGSYKAVLINLEEFESEFESDLIIYLRKGNSNQAIQAEKKYWVRFYSRFVAFLYRKGFLDNYVGLQNKPKIRIRYSAANENPVNSRIFLFIKSIFKD